MKSKVFNFTPSGVYESNTLTHAKKARPDLSIELRDEHLSSFQSGDMLIFNELIPEPEGGIIDALAEMGIGVYVESEGILYQVFNWEADENDS